MAAIETAVSKRHLRFPTGNFNIITLDHLLKNDAIAGNSKHFDDEMDLAGSVGLDGMKVDNIVQTFVYVPVDSKHYASNSFAFVNDQLQADKKDVHLLPESTIRKWRHCSFLHSVSSPSVLRSSTERFTCKDDLQLDTVRCSPSFSTDIQGYVCCQGCKPFQG